MPRSPRHAPGAGARTFLGNTSRHSQPRVDKLVTDTRIRADTLPNQFNIGTHGFSNVGDFIDEADLGRQHGIRCVFGQLGLGVHKHQFVAVTAEGGIHATEVFNGVG